jgi:hypothetical protein
MQKCITCGAELHPERAKKYNYCMSPECQEKNVKGLTMVAVGVNKAAEQYLILDDSTKEELASGKYHDQRRGSFGTSLPAPGAGAPASTGHAAGPALPAPQARPQTVQKPGKPRRAPQASRPAPARAARQPWTDSQRRLALLYNEQGLRPEEIAEKLRLSTYAVTQIILTSRNQGKL